MYSSGIESGGASGCAVRAERYCLDPRFRRIETLLAESPQMIAAQNGVDIEDVMKDIKRFEDMVASNSISMINYEESQSAQPNTLQADQTQTD